MFRHVDVVCLCLVSCVHLVAVLNAAFCMTCIFKCWSGMKDATIWKRHTPEPVS